jgi:hypothetical protein
MAGQNDQSFGSNEKSSSMTAEDIAEHEKALNELSQLEREFAHVELEQRTW